MCDLEAGFKLCSCDAEQLSFDELDWYLDRINAKLPIIHRKGRAAMPHYSEHEQVCLDKILTELNTRQCFDFEYNPLVNDRLCIKVAQKWYAYRFTGGEWKQDKSSSLASWRTQLERHEVGKIN